MKTRFRRLLDTGLCAQTAWMILLSSFLALPAPAQMVLEPSYLSIADGLLSPNVQDVIQDSYGLIWIATSNGIQKYDGYSFQNFKNVSGKPTSLANNVVWELMEDQDHNIWAGHELGVSRYDRNKNEFVNYRFSRYFNVPAAGAPGRTFHMLQDRKGKIWAATGFMEIVQFDADSDKWRFAPYDVAEEKVRLTHYGQSLSITEGPSGIWAGSVTFGLMHLAPGATQFKPVPKEDLGLDLTKAESTISALYADSANTVWIATRSGVYRYYPEQQKLKTLRVYTEDISNGWNNWNSIQPDGKGYVWIANNFRGILRVHAATNAVEEVQIAGRVFMRGHGWNITLTDFTIDRSGIFWFGSREYGLLKYDPVHKPFSVYTHDPLNPKSISSGGAFGILASRKKPGMVYVGTRGDWFSTLDPRTKTFEKHSYKLIDDAYGGSVRSFAEEEDGSLWLGTWGDGLIQLDPQLREVRRYKNQPDDLSTLSNSQIRVIRRDQQGQLWVGTNFGLNILNPKTGRVQRIPAKSTRTYPEELTRRINTLIKDGVSTAIIDQVTDYKDLTQQVIISSAGQYLVVSVGEGDAGGMADYGWITNSSNTQLWTAKEYENSLHAGGASKNRIQIGVLSLEPGNYTLQYHSDDSHSFGIWNEAAPTLTPLYGIALIPIKDPQELKAIGEQLVLKQEMITNGPNIADIEFDQQYVWVGNVLGGLTRLDPVSNSSQYFQNNPDDANSLSNNNVTDLLIDHDGMLWITTNEGLNRMDPATGKITRYGEADGLPTNLTEGLVEGDKGQLWIATQNGLSQMIVNASMGKPTFINFNATDGLGTDVFLALACTRAGDGSFYFGGDHGLTTFTNITPNVTPPAIVFSKLLVSNQSILDASSPVKINGNLLDATKLELAFDQNNLSFEFAALHYANPKRNQYAHFLKGYDKDWVYDNRNFASYTNLDPGSYEFIVRAANSNGVWNEKGRSLVITILPPWWRTWWAYTSYLLLFGSVAFSTDRVMRGRIRQRERERNREKELAQAKEIEKAYNDLKATQSQLIQSEKMASLGELTAGIAHEIQNPLNFVNNFSEVNKELILEMSDELNQGRTEDAKAIAKSILENEEKILYHGRRADSIVKGMLQHSRTSSGMKEPTDINALADEYLRLAYHGLRAKDKSFNATVKTDLDASLGKVNVVPQDLGRVILNLITNGFYAVTEKKKLGFDGYEPTVTVSTRKAGDKVKIMVQDNGVGIPQNIQDKIFQPFFTTKPAGQGTGLGLSMSYDIVTKIHGGQIQVNTRPGEGTEFVITLPGA